MGCCLSRAHDNASEEENFPKSQPKFALQALPGLPNFFGTKYQNWKNDHKINILDGHKIYRAGLTYTKWP
jgi:hypothetical protein